MRRFLLLLTVSAIALIGLSALLSRKGRFLYQKEIPLSGGVVRDRVYEELAFLGGSFHELEFCPRAEPGCRPLIHFRHDSPADHDETNFFAQDLGQGLLAAGIGWQAAWSRDGGLSWQRWNASRDLPGWSCCNYDLVRGLSRDQDRLTLHLNPIPGRSGEEKAEIRLP